LLDDAKKKIFIDLTSITKQGLAPIPTDRQAQYNGPI